MLLDVRGAVGWAGKLAVPKAPAVYFECATGSDCCDVGLRKRRKVRGRGMLPISC